MSDWTPETNRVPTCLLTADELAALKAAKHGWEYMDGGSLEWTKTAHDTPAWGEYTVYRAKPAPAPTLSITVNGVTNAVPEPVTEELRDDDTYWLADPTDTALAVEVLWNDDETDVLWLKRGLIHGTYNAARAHAMAMVGLKAEGV